MGSDYYEKFILPWFEPESGQLVLDVGANMGIYTVRAGQSVGPTGKVIAIEANPRTYSYLRENISLNGLSNIVPLNVAAWNSNCVIKLYRGELGYFSAKKNFSLGFELVPARRISDILEQLGVVRVDWAKIDAEGAEREVLEGMGEFLAESPRIIVEVNRANFQWVREFAKKTGFSLVAISNIDNDVRYYALLLA